MFLESILEFFQIHVRFGELWKIWSYLWCRTVKMHQKFSHGWRTSHSDIELIFWHKIYTRYISELYFKCHWLSIMILYQKLCPSYWIVVRLTCEHKLSRIQGFDLASTNTPWAPADVPWASNDAHDDQYPTSFLSTSRNCSLVQKFSLFTKNFLICF